MPDRSQTDVDWRRHLGGQRGSKHGDWIARRPKFMVVKALAVVLLVGLAVNASAKSPATGLAARDPGARLGGATIVTDGRGGRIFGVPGRSNFIVAVGSGATIVGGGGHDELGALANNVTIRGRGGNDLIHAGRGATIHGGPGRDLIIDAKDDATVRVTSPGDEVVVSGRHDRVLCTKGARNAVIYARASAFISRACRTAGARVLPVSPFRPAQSAQVGAQPVTGDGSNANPFIANCDNDDQHPVDCAVNSFPERKLGRFWSNEYVPAYKCPAHNPYLSNTDYAPLGTSVPNGVEVAGLGPVGVYIGVVKTVNIPRSEDRVVGTGTGIGTSATNWDGYGSAYRVTLHCTSAFDHGYSDE